MSDEIAQEIMEYYAKGDSKKRQRDFISRMEHKLHTKERRNSDRYAR